jgi:mannose-1-phosphate guanylyltransferase
MKAFLLAAGQGTRLRPLTENTPKCLLPIRGVPMLAIWFEICRRSGIDEILVNVHGYADRVSHVAREYGNGLRVHIVEEEQLRGSAGTLRENAAWVAGDKCFWILYADVLTSTNLTAMLRAHESRDRAATLGVYRVSNPKSCGIVRLDDDGTIVEFVEKPSHPASDLAFSGLMIGSQRLLADIPRREPCDIGFDLLPRLSGSMMAYQIPDYLLDIGTIESYQRAQQTWPGLEAA